MSEKLSIASYLSKTPSATLDEVVIRLSSDIPERSHSTESAGPLYRSLMSSVVVPAWLHEELMRFDTISVRDYSGNEFITALINQAPASAPAALRNRQNMINIAKAWITFCVNRLKQFPNMQPCRRLRDADFWCLSSEQTSKFMGLIALREHERLRREQLKRPAETDLRSHEYQLARIAAHMDYIALTVTPPAVPSVIPDEPLASWSSRSRILYFIQSNRGMNDAELLSAVQPPVTMGDMIQVRSEMDLIRDVPDWLHDCIWYHRQDCRLENPILASCISDRKPRNFATARVDRVFPLWKDYCIKPLDEYFASEDLLPLPCKFDVKTRRYNLSDHRWNIYISDQLAASTAA